MDSTPKTPDGKPSTALIEIDGVAHKDGKLVVFFSSGKHRWEIQCKAADLQSFAKFQIKIADELGVWIDHNSQDEPRARIRDEDWADVVRQAWQNGRPE